MPPTPCFLVSAFNPLPTTSTLTFPDQGQGGAQAVEDGASLPVFLFAASSAPLSERLTTFENFRYPRVSQIQNRSRLQREGPKPRPGKLPSIEMWGETALQNYYNAIDEAQKEASKALV